MSLIENPLQSSHQLGDIAYFQPQITKIDARTPFADDSAIPCKVMSVSFKPGKVLYDIALPDGDGAFYEMHPLMRVDSFFIRKPPQD